MKELAKKLIRKSFDLAGLKIQRKDEQRKELELEDGNLVVPKIWDQPYFKQLLPFRLDSSDNSVVLLGNAEQLEFLGPGFAERGHDVKAISYR